MVKLTVLHCIDFARLDSTAKKFKNDEINVATLNTTVDKFFKAYGTHFIQQANMGARLSVTQRYKKKDWELDTTDNIRKCNKLSAKVCINSPLIHGMGIRNHMELRSISFYDVIIV